MTWYPANRKTNEIPAACRRRLNSVERAEKEHQLWRICTPAAEQMPPRYAGDDQPDLTYNQAHGLID